MSTFCQCTCKYVPIFNASSHVMMLWISGPSTMFTPTVCVFLLLDFILFQKHISYAYKKRVFVCRSTALQNSMRTYE